MIRWQRNSSGVCALRALLLILMVFGFLPLSAGTAHADDVNFNEHIGPIIHKHCSSCHRDGGVGPFELIKYRDVAVRAEQILEVIGSGYMPPWLPESQEREFDGVRRLSAVEKDLLKRWSEAETPEGGGKLTLPVYSSKWLLGEPDVELKINEPFLMPAEGPDVFRNFVLPPSLDRTRYVTAFDFRPEPVAPIHHAVLRLDHTGRSRTLDAEDPLPGFGGMENGRLTFGGFSRDPGGRLLGWLPGKIPSHEPQTAWVIHPDDDIVFQLHLQAQGKQEKVKGTVALYLSDTPPPLPTYLSLIHI